jgi:hypothetical protein
MVFNFILSYLIMDIVKIVIILFYLFVSVNLLTFLSIQHKRKQHKRNFINL